MRLVDDHQRGVRPGDPENLNQRGRVPVHGIDAFYHYEDVGRSVASVRAKSSKRGVEMLNVVVAEQNGLLLSLAILQLHPNFGDKCFSSDVTVCSGKKG